VLRPDHLWAYMDWSACNIALGNLPNAQIGLTACTQLRPDAPWPYYNRGDILTALS
jgi:hypothetical protein